MLRNADGLVLPVLLFLLLALTGVVHVAFLIAFEELRGSRTSLSLLRVRMEAESALLRASAGLPNDSVERRWQEGGELFRGSFNERAMHRVRAVPLTAEYVLLEAHAEEGEGAPRHRAGRVHWRLDPEEELNRLAAGLEYVGTLTVSEEGSVTHRSDGGPSADGSRGDCPWSGALSPVAVRPVSPDGESSFPSFGILSIPEAGRAYSGARAGTVALDHDVRPFPIPLSEESMRLREGSWSGVIAVGGDLQVEGGAELAGVVLVGGDLEVRDDAVVEGVVRVGGHVRVVGRGQIRTDPCALGLLPTTAADLLRAVPLPTGSWLAPL